MPAATIDAINMQCRETPHAAPVFSLISLIYAPCRQLTRVTNIRAARAADSDVTTTPYARCRYCRRAFFIAAAARHTPDVSRPATNTTYARHDVFRYADISMLPLFVHFRHAACHHYAARFTPP